LHILRFFIRQGEKRSGTAGHYTPGTMQKELRAEPAWDHIDSQTSVKTKLPGSN